MDNNIIKEALAYSMGYDLHEDRRQLSKLEDGTYKPRIKKSKDEKWNSIHGTDEVDIANCSFEDLPRDWQYENLEAARVVINLVFDRVMNDERIKKDQVIEMATIVHDEWLKRNSWVFDSNYGNPVLAVPFDKLPKEEKEKDISQVKRGIYKVLDYKNGLFNIDSLLFKFNLDVL